MLHKFRKFGQAILLGTAFAALLPLWAYASTPEDISAQALVLAGDEKHAAALELINQQPYDVKQSYDVRFTRARILAWAGDHEASAAEYESLLSAYPGNPDIQNGYGYLEYYREDLDQAEYYFNQVLENYPGYEDARKGLKRVAGARADKLGTDYNWRIDASSEISSFNNGQADWNTQSVRVEYVPGRFAVFGSASRYERFGLNDLQFMAGLRSNSNSDFNWEIGAGFTPDADFRADFTGLGRVGYKFDLGNDTIIHSSVGYQFDDYGLTGDVHQVTPELVAYLDNGMVFTNRLIHVMQDGQADQTGFLFSGLTPVTERLSARLGYANAPETVDGVAISTESVFGGLSYQLSDNTNIHGTYSLDNRKGVYIRDGFNVGLTQKY